MEEFVKKSLAKLSHEITYSGQSIDECLDFALKYPEENWNWCNLTKSRNLTVEILREHIHRQWNWDYLSDVKYINFIDEFPEKNWNWFRLCNDIHNVSISYYFTKLKIPTEFIIKNIDKPWNWKGLMRMNEINFFKIMDECPYAENIQWNWGLLSFNININVDVLRKHIDKPWSFNELSYSPQLTIDIVRLFPEADWDFYGVSSSPKISLKDMLANPDLPWNFGGASANPGITYEEAQISRIGFVCEATEPSFKSWDHVLLCKKEGGIASFIEYTRRRYAAETIQKYWRACVSNPTYNLCKRRLEWELADMNRH
jgi:hypothetical protein